MLRVIADPILTDAKLYTAVPSIDTISPLATPLRAGVPVAEPVVFLLYILFSPVRPVIVRIFAAIVSVMSFVVAP